MSTPNLDKTLDDIIGSKPKANRSRARTAGAKRNNNKVGKATGGVAKKDVSKLKEGASTGAKNKRKSQNGGKNSDDPFHLAVKVTISNFPVDINESKLTDFLAKEIGQVKDCTGVYDRKGKPTGKFTVEFTKEGKALATFKKLNGTPMDNGAKILKVEIHTDPNNKSLASRLGSNTSAEPQTPKKPVNNNNNKKKADGKKASQKKKAAAKPARAKVSKKTAEELDAEMDDYINSKDAISV